MLESFPQVLETVHTVIFDAGCAVGSQCCQVHATAARRATSITFTYRLDKYRVSPSHSPDEQSALRRL